MAVRLCPYKTLREFYDLSFVNWKDGQDSALEIIVPSPDLADILRERLKNHPCYSQISVSTISYSISSKLRQFDCPKPVIRKAQILLHFSTVWQKYFNEYDFALFSNAYEIFSDWRSYSTDLNLFENALQSIDPIIKKAVMFFWTYLEQMDFLDEHGAYEYLAKAYREKRQTCDLMFFGFTHLSGTQISMLQSFAENVDVYLPIHENILDKCQSTDWIPWLSPVNKQDKVKKNIQLNFKQWATFEKSELNSILNRKSDKCLILGAQDAIGHMAEVHEKGDFFKLSYDFLKIDEQRFAEKFKKVLLLNDKEKIAAFIFNEKKYAIENKNWKQLKINELYQEALDFLSKVDLVFDQFIFTVIRSYVQLNLPRNYVLTVNQDIDREILKSEYLWAPDLETPIDVIVKGDDSIFSNGSLDYSSEVFKVLATIGPIQRLGLRADWLKFHLNEVLNLNGELYIDAGLLETSSFWKQQSLFNKNTIKPKLENLGMRDYFWKLNLGDFDFSFLKSKTFSPSELQKYIDCPRSYLVSYGISLDPRIKNEEEIEPSAIGDLEHSLVELYFKNNDKLDEDNLLALASKSIDETIVKKQKKISAIDKEVILEEVVSYSTNVLEKLYQLRALPGFDYDFEKEFKNIELGIHGRLDFFYQTDHGFGIIDFKRSKVPSYSEVAQTKVVQLWCYLFGMNLNLENCTLEYFNLSAPEKSWGIGKNYENHLIKLPKSFKSDIEENALANLKQIIQQIRNESIFKIAPRKSSVCQFCPASPLCPRVQREELTRDSSRDQSEVIC